MQKIYSLQQLLTFKLVGLNPTWGAPIYDGLPSVFYCPVQAEPSLLADPPSKESYKSKIKLKKTDKGKSRPPPPTTKEFQGNTDLNFVLRQNCDHTEHTGPQKQFAGAFE